MGAVTRSSLFWRALGAATLATVVTSAVGCGSSAPGTSTPPATASAPKRYAFGGQVLVVNSAKQSLSIKHNDIVGYMPAMTMTFQVARPDLMQGREPGEMIVGTLEVDDTSGKIVEITRTGMAPVPDRANGSIATSMLDVGDTAPDAALIDQFDKRRSFSEWKGTPTLVTFIYTRCPLPNFCPLMDKNFASLQKQVLADAALNGKVKLVSVSFDPANDTPAVLQAHAKKLGADPSVWTFLTADAVTIERFAAKFGVGLVPDGSTGGEITHNLRTTLIGADGKIQKIYNGSDWSVATAMSDLRAAAASAGK